MTSCLPYPVLQPSIVRLTMLVLTFIRFVAHSFSRAYFLLLSFYCHLPVRKKRKIELIPKEKEENLLAQGNREFSIIFLV